jgi:superfamily II DNA/RNA helicase
LFWLALLDELTGVLLSPTFADLGVPAEIVALLERDGITTPFPIQEATLPDALAGRDVCGRAPTGSGKTLAFAIAIVQALGDGPHSASRRPRGLVLVPTRELAAQVCGVLAPLARARGLRVLAVYGGTGYGPQLSSLRSGVDVVVACPGRLEDLITRRDVHLDQVSIAVVDEADRMADMGFLPAVKRILDQASPGRQVLLFSATLDGEVDVLIRRYQHDPVRHDVDSTPESQGDVSHLFWKAAQSDRVRLASMVVAGHETSIVFCRTRHGADRLSRQFAAAGVQAVALHGNRTQAQRDSALRAFHSRKARVLVATDVAARGIDVENVACVLQFDPPGCHKDYLHRAGRTGRAGADGTVISLVTPEQTRFVRAMQRDLALPQGISEPGSLPPVAPRAESSRPRADNPRSSEVRPRQDKPAPRMPKASGPTRRSFVKDSTGPAFKAAARRAPSRQPKAHSGPPRQGSTGILKWYDPVRGFGFIVPDAGGRDVFVHRCVLDDLPGVVEQGSRVRFVSRRGPKGLEAVELSAR